MAEGLGRAVKTIIGDGLTLDVVHGADGVARVEVGIGCHGASPATLLSPVEAVILLHQLKLKILEAEPGLAFVENI